MKNIRFFCIFMIAMIATTVTSFAQHTVPRFGTAPNQNKTFGGLDLGLDYVADTAGATPDTLTISPHHFTSNYIVTLTDSMVLSVKSAKDLWLGDNFTVTIENTSGSGHWVQFLGYSGLASVWGMTSTGTKILLASGKSATLSFYFDGVFVNEKSRAIR